MPRDSAPPLDEDEDEDELLDEDDPELDPPPGRFPLGYNSRPSSISTSSASIRVEVRSE